MLGVTLGAAMPLTGCETGPRISKETGELVQPVKIENSSTRAVRINVLVGRRDLDSPLLLAPRLGIKKTIRSGDTLKYDVVLAEPDDKEPPFADEMVFRFRVEVIYPHWRVPRVAWYELLGPLPEQVRMSDGFSGVLLSATGLDFALVPEEYWQLEEQANALYPAISPGDESPTGGPGGSPPTTSPGPEAK